MTTDDRIAVLQEFKKNGNKNIEVKVFYSGVGWNWEQYGGGGDFNFAGYNYRIKRQPQEVTLFRQKETREVYMQSNQLAAEFASEGPKRWELVTFREVLDDE